jgi:asparagine synthase (glutamine-hydrolysing)
LSGGLDSSTVAGLLAEVTQTPARSFTIGFDSERHDEMHYARAAVKHFKLTPYQHYLTPDEAVAVLPMMARLYDEPFGNSSAIPTYYCGKLARENGVGVLLAGDGGDELFAGNSRYGTQTVFEHYNRIPSILRKGLLEPIALALPDGMRFAPLRKLRNYVRYAMTPMPDRMLAYEHMSESEARSTFERAFLNGVDLAQPMAIARRAYTRPESQSMLQRMMHLDLEIALADNDLRKVTVMTRAAGIRVRFPFLDEDLAAFSARVPPPLLMKGSALRSFYKFALKDFLPPDVLAKKKHGFGMPYDLWLRTNPRMKEIICDSLTRFKRRGYCVGKYLDDLVASHDKDDSRSAGRAWDIMTLELWLQARGLS